MDMVVSWTILKTPAAGCLKWRQNAGHIEQHPNTNPVLYWPPEVTRRSYRTLTARDCQLCSPGLSVVFSKIRLDRTSLVNDPYKHLVLQMRKRLTATFNPTASKLNWKVLKYRPVDGMMRRFSVQILDTLSQVQVTRRQPWRQPRFTQAFQKTKWVFSFDE